MTKLTALVLAIGLAQVAIPQAAIQCPTPEAAFFEIQRVIDQYRAGSLTSDEFAAAVTSIDPQECRGFTVPDCGKDCSHIVE